MRPEKERVRCTHPHYCYEWDSMFITPLMPEFEACICLCHGEGATKMSEFKGLTRFEQKLLKEYLDSLNK